MNKNVMTGVYTHNGEENGFNYFVTLNAMDKLKFVKTVTDTLVGDDYYSSIRDMIFDFVFIDLFTSIDVSEIKESTNSINMIEDFIHENNIMDIIRANVEGDLIDELNKAVDDNIEFRTGIHKNPIAEGIGSLLKTLEKKVSEIDTESMTQMAQVISGMSGELNPEKVFEAYAKSDLFKKNHPDIENESNVTDITTVKRTRSRKKKEPSEKE